MIKFDVFNRFSGAVQFTAEIDCSDDAPVGVKLGLAVKWGHLNGASLASARLDGARLDGASLDGASLDGASLDRASLNRASLNRASLIGAILDGAILDGACLNGASFASARLDGASVVRLVARATRSDGYEFFAWELDDGRLLIRAGCQAKTLDAYRVHVWSYGSEVKRRETTDILDFIERRASSPSEVL